MGAATQDRETGRVEGKILDFPVGEAKRIYRGTLAVTDDATMLAEAGTNATAKTFCGVTYEQKDNTLGAASALNIRVYQEGVFTFPYTGTAPVRKQKLYLSDDQTVTVAPGYVCVGVAEKVDTSATTVDIDISQGLQTSVYAVSSGTAITVTSAQVSGKTFTVIASAAGTQAVAIPGAATVVAGTVMIIKKTGSAGAVTITPGAGTIAGGATHAALDALNDVAMFVAVGTDWVLGPSVIA